MKFDFDTFEFTGLIAPGSVILLAAILLQPHLLRAGDAAVLIALAVIGAYIAGHLVAAIANATEPLFRTVGVRDLESLPLSEWKTRGYLAEDQVQRLATLVATNLYRSDPIDEVPSLKRTTILKQMYLAVLANDSPQRLQTFDGLYNLSRGLTVSLILCALAAIVTRHYVFSGACVLAAALALYRTRKFKGLYARELLQTFLLLEVRAPSSPSGEKTEKS